MPKYIVIVGGVFSGTGKGCSAASIALLLKMRGLRVNIAKFDGYYNENAGCLSPGEHGETFVLDDGTECDLDLGSYERIVGINISRKNITTNGTLYRELLENHDQGKFLGKTLQLVPHYTGLVIDRLTELGENQDVVLAEIGGTVGDLENVGFLEAVRQFKQKNSGDVLILMVAPILWVPTISEFKTKPLQSSVKTLQSFGLQPDILLCRTPSNPPLPAGILDKVANMTNVDREAVFEAPDVQSIYQVPIEFWNRHIDDLIVDKFHFQRNGVRIHKYRDLVEKYVNADELPEVEIGIVGKYDNQEEAYISLKEALYHAGLSHNVRVRRRWISAEVVEESKSLKKIFEGLHGVIVPGGFDVRGVEGKIRAIKYCREQKIPFLGICLGLQCAVIEFARFIGLDSNSQEFNPKTEHPVVHYLDGQEGIHKKSATMRLGAYSCTLTKDSLAFEAYKKKMISERHRHRLEVNDEYLERLAARGFRVTGRHVFVDPAPEAECLPFGPESLVEIMELDRDDHPFFLGTQYHPEFRSRLGAPAPLFASLIGAAVTRKSLCETKESETQ